MRALTARAVVWPRHKDPMRLDVTSDIKLDAIKLSDNISLFITTTGILKGPVGGAKEKKS